MPGRTDLAEAVARNLFKLMAIKDEYEVARLWTDGSFLRQLGAEFERWDALEVHLAPPLLAERDDEGPPQEAPLRPLDAPRDARRSRGLKRLRGTALDPFGRTAERRMERRLLADYETLLDELLRAPRRRQPRHRGRARPRPRRRSAASATSRRPTSQRAKAAEAALLERWRSPRPALQAAE